MIHKDTFLTLKNIFIFVLNAELKRGEWGVGGG
jgi:hypothetical protein